MNSYQEFLQQLQALTHSSTSSTSASPSPRSPYETFEQLCFDFPNFPLEDLEYFKGELRKQIEEEKYSSFPISNKFINGIMYGSSVNRSTDSQYFEHYSTINAIIFVKLMRNAMRYVSSNDHLQQYLICSPFLSSSKSLEELNEILQEYNIEEEEEIQRSSNGLIDQLQQEGEEDEVRKKEKKKKKKMGSNSAPGRIKSSNATRYR